MLVDKQKNNYTPVSEVQQPILLLSVYVFIKYIHTRKQRWVSYLAMLIGMHEKSGVFLEASGRYLGSR